MTSSSLTPHERRRSEQRQSVRRTILDATEALLLEQGPERFSMRRLAERCGYTAPTIYHHFGDKQGLLDAVVEEPYRLALERIGKVPRHSDPLDTLRVVVLELARFGIENPTYYRLLSIARSPDLEPPESAENTRVVLDELLGQIEAAGRLRARDRRQAMHFLWVVLHGVVSLRINRPDADWDPDITQFSIETALGGLVAPLEPVDPSGREQS